MTQETWAASHTVAIASFNYTPADVRVAVGDTVVWTNADPTVHTVTAFRREFSSGAMHQRQRFTVRFDAPGVYPYFCEPHEFMRGTVSVTGAAAAPAATTTSTTSGTSAAPGVATTAVLSPTATTTTTTTAAPGTTGTTPGGKSVAVVVSELSGGTDRPSPLVASVLTLLVAVGAVLLLRRRVPAVDALRFAAAGCTAVAGAVHLQLRLALAYPEPIGTLLVIEAAGAAILTAWLLSAPFTRRVQVTAVAAHLAALAALAVTRTSIGLFGFHELGWDPSPQLPIALTVSLVAVALLGLARPAVSVAGWPAA